MVSSSGCTKKARERRGTRLWHSSSGIETRWRWKRDGKQSNAISDVILGGFRLFTVPYFSVGDIARDIARLTIYGGHLDFQMYRGGTHARWQPVRQSARTRRSYGKIGDCWQSRADLKGKTFSHSMYLACKRCEQGYNSHQWGPVHTYSDIF